jgi:predicted NUDIX family NTP pyrophosphohydrolase
VTAGAGTFEAFPPQPRAAWFRIDQAVEKMRQDRGGS